MTTHYNIDGIEHLRFNDLLMVVYRRMYSLISKQPQCSLEAATQAERSKHSAAVPHATHGDVLLEVLKAMMHIYVEILSKYEILINRYSY